MDVQQITAPLAHQVLEDETQAVFDPRSNDQSESEVAEGAMLFATTLRRQTNHRSDFIFFADDCIAKPVPLITCSLPFAIRLGIGGVVSQAILYDIVECAEITERKDDGLELPVVEPSAHLCDCLLDLLWIHERAPARKVEGGSSVRPQRSKLIASESTGSSDSAIKRRVA